MRSVRTVLSLLLVAPLCLQAGCNSSAGQSEDLRTFDEWAASTAVPIRTTEPGGAFDDLMPLKAMIGSAPAVALGEPRHDIHEIFQFKHRLIEFLVKEMDFTAFVLELGLPAGKKIDDYVNGGAGQLEELDTGFTSFFGAYEEVLALVRWMRSYNEDPANTRKLHFYGMDMPGAGATMMPALEVALAYLDDVDPEYANSMRNVLLPVAKELNPRTYRDLTVEGRNELTAAIELLVARFENQRVVYVSRTTEEAYDWSYRHALSARQVNTNIVTGASGVSAEIGFNARERALADNLHWIMNREGRRNGRIIVWGHNGHVQRSSITGLFPNPPTTMGMYLKSYRGDDVFTIGSTFGKGTLKAVGSIEEEVIEEAKVASAESALRAIDLPMFILNLSNLPETGPVQDWLGQEPEMRLNTIFVKTNLRQAFDALFYVGEVSRAHHTEGARKRLNAVD